MGGAEVEHVVDTKGTKAGKMLASRLKKWIDKHREEVER